MFIYLLEVNRLTCDTSIIKFNQTSIQIYPLNVIWTILHLNFAVVSLVSENH